MKNSFFFPNNKNIEISITISRQMSKLHLANDPIFSPKIPYDKGIV